MDESHRLDGDIAPDGQHGRAFEDWQSAVRERLADADAGYIDLYVRSMSPPAGAKSAQTALVEQLTEFTAAEQIEDVRMNVWGERLCLCETCAETATGRAILETVRELEAWGEELDAPVESLFERRQVESSVTGESTEAIVPPRVTAALYLDAELVGVFPCRMAGTHYTVHDLCRALEDAIEESTSPPLERS